MDFPPNAPYFRRVKRPKKMDASRDVPPFVFLLKFCSSKKSPKSGLEASLLPHVSDRVDPFFRRDVFARFTATFAPSRLSGRKGPGAITW